MNELALFAGAGGGILGGKLLGWKTVCAVEINEYCAKVLMQRQNEGYLPPFPIWDDVRTFDGKPWKNIVDVVSGGFPCQDISIAGIEQKGIEGKQSRLWFEMARIISEIRPSFAFVENTPILTSRGLSTILGQFSEMGYNAKWGIISAAQVGAPHQRKRIWITAYSNEKRLYKNKIQKTKCFKNYLWREQKEYDLLDACKAWEDDYHELFRMDDGLANRMEQFKCIGEGQVPAVVRMAWRTLIEL